MTQSHAGTVTKKDTHTHRLIADQESDRTNKEFKSKFHTDVRDMDKAHMNGEKRLRQRQVIRKAYK
jgi:hypothetical protein